MNLGQMMLVIAALSLLGVIVLNTNRTILQTNETQNTSEFGITAVSLATSLVEEAGGKMFDEVVADSNTLALTSPTQLSTTLGPEGGQSYRDSLNDFNDVDDFNGLVLAYRNPLDSTACPGATKIISMPGLRAKFYARVRVDWVNPTSANGYNVDSVATVKTWHKKITVTVTAYPAMTDTLVYPAVISYWN
jgi:hypothetical protein